MDANRKGIKMSIDWSKLLFAIFLCQAAGLLGARYTRPALKPWYASLKKPSFTPPNWLFAPAWITLYLLMAFAFYLVWMKGAEFVEVRLAIFVFTVQLLLNTVWSYIFFGKKLIFAGLVDIVLLWISIAVCLLLFWKLSVLAGLLLVPYFIWVTFAMVLNFSIWKLNS